MAQRHRLSKRQPEKTGKNEGVWKCIFALELIWFHLCMTQHAAESCQASQLHVNQNEGLQRA